MFDVGCFFWTLLENFRVQGILKAVLEGRRIASGLPEEESPNSAGRDAA